MEWLFTAFAIVWFAVFAYVFSLGRKQQALSKEIEGLKARLARDS
ncbi:MAG: CcmD family protein [bacterium]